MPVDIPGVVRAIFDGQNDDRKIAEIEVRFQGFMRTQIFHNFLLRRYSFSSIEKSESVRYENGFRAIDNVVWKKVSKHDVKEHRFKLDISSEEQLVDFDVNDLGKPLEIRNRLRRKAQLSENVYLVLTTINGTSYETEVESEITLENLDQTEEIVKEFFKVFDDFFANVAEVYYFNFKDFLEKFNKRTPHMSGTMDPFVLARPRNFKIKDFTTGNRTDLGIDSGYTITVKGDGLNTVLFINKGRVLCAARPTQKYFEVLDTRLNGYGPFSSIYVGEETNQADGTKLFTVFDILFDSRNQNIPLLANHLERLEIAKEYSKPFQTAPRSGIKFYFKDFFPIGKTPETFAVAYKKATKDAETRPFGNDGFVLTPIYTIHNPVDLKLVKRDENIPLGKMHNLLKIKPVEKMSIDFIPTLDRELYCNYGVPFKGTDDFPFNAKVNVNWNSIPEGAYNKVVEFVPETTEPVAVLKFERIREDKTEPNTEKIAKDDWEDIIKPVTNEIFLNETYTRLWRQNNRVKTELISKYPDQCIVVDIGTGNGGDLYKYQDKAIKVICVEPDLQNRTELLRRISTLDISKRDKFIVLSVGGQDYNEILDAYIAVKREFPSSPTVVSAMLSLTFFWKSRKFLDSLLVTIGAIASLSPDTKFGFLVVDGKRFRKIFDINNKIREKGLLADFKTDEEGGISLPGMVKIKIENTIVRSQKEYLVNLEDMLPDVKIDWFKVGILERYLSQKEKKYGETHIYGIGTVNGNYSVSKMIRSRGLDIPFSSNLGKLKFEEIGSNYYRIRSTSSEIGEGDCLSNFLTVLVDGYESDPETYRTAFLNDFVESLSQPDPRYPGKRIRELYSGQDPLTLFPSATKVMSNARIYTLSRGRFQNAFFDSKKRRGESDSLIDIVKAQLNSSTPSILLYLMVADYLEVSVSIIDGFSDMVNYEPLFEERWISLPKSYITVFMITDEDSDKIFPVGERGLDGKIITRFVN